MIPYSRPQLSDFYTLFETKLAENHTLHSGTYLYSSYMGVPTRVWEVAGGGGGVWVGIGTRRWKKSRTLNQRRNFNKAPAKALFSLVPVFKYKLFFQDLELKLIPKPKVENSVPPKNRPASASRPQPSTCQKKKNNNNNKTVGPLVDYDSPYCYECVVPCRQLFRPHQHGIAVGHRTCRNVRLGST